MTLPFLSLPQFRAKFARHPIPTYAQFKKRSVVVHYSGERVPLMRAGISEEVMQTLYAALCDRDRYLDAYYRASLEVKPLHDLGTERPDPLRDISNDTHVKYKNVVRNLFFREILQDTSSGLSRVPSYWTAVWGFYALGEIDYQLISPFALDAIRRGKFASLLSSLYFRASIMNPFFVYSLQGLLMERGADNVRVFTPTMGWGSYMVGLLETGRVVEYVGVDVIPRVCRVTQELMRAEWPHVRGEIICRPSENLGKAFAAKYRGHFDVVFFSPPYFQLELYSGGEQSTASYPTYEAWLEGYWRPTAALCAHVVRPKGKVCFVVSDYGAHSLVRDMQDIMGEVGGGALRFIRRIGMGNKQVAYRTRKREEQIVVFERSA